MYFKIVKRCLIVMVCFYLVSCGGGNGGQVSNTMPNNSNPYLAKPTGPYQVGYKDYHYLNTGICPDVNYTGSNQNYFSPGNTQYCHEIMTRIYYPSNYNLPTPYSLYYRPVVLDLESFIIFLDPSISLSQAQQLESMTSYSRPDLPLTLGSFPVIFFSPGNGTQVQYYENILTQLASSGYIVVAINSVFISGSVQLPDGVIVPFAPQETGALAWQIEYPEQYGDLEFMYQQIVNNNDTDPIFAEMDLRHIGASGHSFGGLAIVEAANHHPGWFQAVSPLDEGFDANESGIVAKFILPVVDPILYQLAATTNVTLSVPQPPWNITYAPLVTNASYRVAIAPSLTNGTYSTHGNFIDFSTLQYQPIINQAFAYSASSGITILGTGNGFDITNSINGYLLPFFNYYLKNLSPNPFTGCKPLTNNTVLTCGPGS